MQKYTNGEAPDSAV